MCYLYMIELVWTSCSTWNLRRSFSPSCQKWLDVFAYSLSIWTTSKRQFSGAGNVISSQRTFLNTDWAEQLIDIHDKYGFIKHTINKGNIRLDREQGKDSPRLIIESDEKIMMTTYQAWDFNPNPKKLPKP